jgi:hypothetical protein
LNKIVFDCPAFPGQGLPDGRLHGVGRHGRGNMPSRGKVVASVKNVGLPESDARLPRHSQAISASGDPPVSAPAGVDAGRHEYAWVYI